MRCLGYGTAALAVLTMLLHALTGSVQDHPDTEHLWAYFAGSELVFAASWSWICPIPGHSALCPPTSTTANGCCISPPRLSDTSRLTSLSVFVPAPVILLQTVGCIITGAL